MTTIIEQSPEQNTNPLLPLAGKKGLITGVANDKSIAFAVAKAVRALGEEDRIAGVDLADVVDEQHHDHPVDVDGRRGIARQRGRQQRDLPTVLGRVLIPLQPERAGLARYALELVDLQNEVNDLLHDHCPYTQPVN